MNPYAYVFLISMLPFIELRGSIPYGLAILHLDPLITFIVAVIGNVIPVPLILIFLEDLEKFARGWDSISRIMDKIFERTYSKADKKVRRWEYIALIFFVAIPLPGTGAWTGSLIAYLFKMRVGKAFIAILIGVVIAGIAITLAVMYGLTLL